MALSRFLASNEETKLNPESPTSNQFHFLLNDDYVDPVPEGIIIDDQPIEFPHRRSIDMSETEHESFAVDAIAGSLLLDERCRYMSNTSGWSYYRASKRGQQSPNPLYRDIDTESLSDDDYVPGAALNSTCSTPTSTEGILSSRGGFRLLRPRGSFFSLHSNSSDRSKKADRKRQRPNLRVDTSGRPQRESFFDMLSDQSGSQLFGCFKSNSHNALYDCRPRTSSLPHVDRGRKVTDLFPFSNSNSSSNNNSNSHSNTTQQGRPRRSSDQHLAPAPEKRRPKLAISVPNLQNRIQRCASSLGLLRSTSSIPHSPASDVGQTPVTPDQGYYSPGLFSMSDLDGDSTKGQVTRKQTDNQDTYTANEIDEYYDDEFPGALPVSATDSLDAGNLISEVISANKDYGAPDEWQDVFIRLMALFNEEYVSACLEDIALVVRRCAVRRIPENIKDSITAFLDAGMYALYSRIAGLTGPTLLAEMARLWRHFHSHIMSYLGAAFRGIRHFSVRDLLLCSFRDHIFLPMAKPLEDVFSLLKADDNIRRKEEAASVVQMCGLLLNASRSCPCQADVAAIWKRLTAQWRSVSVKHLPIPLTAYV
ncbi:hypothetical protein BDF22DRAFT_679420 [Syncephalis plumigaleata]|nr:hypothetical protein BDF22DRAFT_679420 [Syncephalis plumigaleata]